MQYYIDLSTLIVINKYTYLNWKWVQNSRSIHPAQMYVGLPTGYTVSRMTGTHSVYTGLPPLEHSVGVYGKFVSLYSCFMHT